MCVYSDSRNDVPRVAQRYGTIAAHTRRRASVLVVFVVFCVHMHSFAGLIRRTSPPTFSDTAITDRHSDTTIFQLRAHWVRISWSIGSEKSFGHVPPGGSRTLDFLRGSRAPYPLGQALRFLIIVFTITEYLLILRHSNRLHVITITDYNYPRTQGYKISSCSTQISILFQKLISIIISRNSAFSRLRQA